VSGSAPLVSIALPAYNAAGTLATAIRSVLWQTYRNFELLVLDDGSSDATAQVASGFDDPRIRVIGDGTNLGLAQRLNQAIDTARGELFARMDADDIAYPQRLELQVAHLLTHPGTDLVGARALIFRDDGSTAGTFTYRGTHEEICARPWTTFHLPHPTWTGRIAWFRRHRYRLPEVVRAEDQDLLLRAYPESRYYCLRQILLGYRQGRTTLRNTLTARRSLAMAHVREHAHRRRYGAMLMAPSYILLKSCFDVAASLLGWQRLFLAQVAAPPNAEELAEWRRVWSELCRPDPPARAAGSNAQARRSVG